MRRYSILGLLILLTAACSSQVAETPRNSSDIASKPGQVPAANTSSNSEPTTQANAAETDASGNENARPLNARKEMLRRKLALASNRATAGPVASLQYRAGAENSQTATTMNSAGQAIEIRVFKTHPRLARVEAVWLDEKAKILKFTFRDGRTSEVRTDKVASLVTASTQALMEIALQAR
ncbi:MAG TPA: hypothetical protein VGO43_12460 [Pyrinomonadaceae bacterium]|jgi:hypothetical protein|nr:hypothetical protein [Pyrinomonadaceae bacterium]